MLDKLKNIFKRHPGSRTVKLKCREGHKIRVRSVTDSKLETSRLTAFTNAKGPCAACQAVFDELRADLEKNYEVANAEEVDDGTQPG